MADINFDCPNCGQNLDAPEEMSGVTIHCPQCKALCVVPGILNLPTAENPPPPDQDKGSTVRITIPQEFNAPPPTHRHITIKRMH
jgi:phage FluMu protein Com